MTVNFEVPWIRYAGNGVATVFTFTWTCDDANELYVQIDDVLQVQGVGYQLLEFDTESGGEVHIEPAPDADTDILIYRETPVTQQVDYVDHVAFPQEAHEGQMDKDTRILQEIIEGGRGIGGPIDLDSIERADEVEITNTSGANAIIPLWDCDADLAGVYAGEVTLSAPNDGDATTKPDGYIWLEVASLS